MFSVKKLVDGGIYRRYSPEDAFRISGHKATLRNTHILDMIESDGAHEDAIQLLPPSAPGFANQQYAGASLQNAKVYRNEVISKGSLQGILGTDGRFINFTCNNNIIRTNSAHLITVNGIMSAHFAGNLDSAGKLIKINAYPLRIGGGENIWITGFKGNHKYSPITGNNPVNDCRTTINSNLQGTYLSDFEMDLFFYEKDKIKYLSAENYCQELALLARSCGKIIGVV